MMIVGDLRLVRGLTIDRAVQQAYSADELGCHAVCIGAAASRPQHTARHPDARG